MKYKRLLLFNLFLGFSAATIIVFLSQSGPFKRVEFIGLDFAYNLRKQPAFDQRIIIVEISDSELVSVGRWPWERKWLAAMVEALKGLGSRITYLDFVLSEPSGHGDDALLANACQRAGNVYMPLVFRERTNRIKKALVPLEAFEKHIAGMGAINIYPDSDGVVRRIPLYFSSDEQSYPHLALKIASDYAGLTLSKIAPTHLMLSGTGKNLRIPLVEMNTMLINWTGRWQKTFKHYGFLEVLAAYKDLLDGEKPQINTADFKDSICLVGVTSIGLYDIKPIPLEPEYPSIGVIANTVNSVLTGNFLLAAPPWLNSLIIYILALFPAFCATGARPFRSLIMIVSAAVIYLALSLVLFQCGFVLQIAIPVLTVLFSGIGIETYHFMRIEKEKQKFFKLSITDGLTGLFNIRYFTMLLEGEITLASPALAPQFCVIMTDIDHFKKFNDTYGHQVGDLVLKETAAVLKSVVRTSDIVARYGGEEMIILLRGATLQNGIMIAEKIRKAVENHLVKDEKNTYQVSISVGLANFRHENSAEAIIKKADAALYKAKETGRNRACYVDAEEQMQTVL